VIGRPSALRVPLDKQNVTSRYSNGDPANCNGMCMWRTTTLSARQLRLTSHSLHRCVYRCHWDVGCSSEHSRFESLEDQGFVLCTLSRPPFRSNGQSGEDVKLIILIHVLPNKVLSACLQSPTWYVRNVAEDPESNYVMNTTNLIQTSLSLTLIKVQSLHMFRALLVHLQETLHERRFGGYCVRLSCHTRRPTHIYNRTQ
jgi:hypothetical protein